MKLPRKLGTHYQRLNTRWKGWLITLKGMALQRIQKMLPKKFNTHL